MPWAALLPCVTLLFLACLTFPALAEPGRWHVSLTGEDLVFRDMGEPERHSPLFALLGEDDPATWTRDWREERCYLTVGYELWRGPHVSLQPRAHLGGAQGRFAARNGVDGFEEVWNTRTALLWGPGLALELRVDPESGPFVLATWDLFMAQAAERRERINGVDAGDERRARFSWREHDVALLAGWRVWRFSLMAGTRRTWFRLRKKLDYHVDTSTLRPGSQDMLIAQTLNGEASRYLYENDGAWLPHVALECRLSEHWHLGGELTLAEDAQLALRMRFTF